MTTGEILAVQVQSDSVGFLIMAAAFLVGALYAALRPLPPVQMKTSQPRWMVGRWRWARSQCSGDEMVLYDAASDKHFAVSKSGTRYLEG